MKECIAIINQKGGVGKSTTALSLGAGLSSRGLKVLFIDLDAQGNLSYNMGAATKKVSSLEVLLEKASIEEALIHTRIGDIVPASPLLAGADASINQTGKEYKLKEALQEIKSQYDYIIIDTPPALSILTVNALASCNSVIIPAQADSFSLQGIGQLSQTIQAVRKYCNPQLKIKGIVITRYNARAVLSRDMTEMLEDTAHKLGTKVFNTKIRECIAVKEAQAVQEDILTYSPGSNATSDYLSLLAEIMESEV